MSKTFKTRPIFIGLFTATLAAMLGIGIIEPILPLYAKNMGVSGLMVGFIFACFALSRGIFAPIIGQFSDRNGRKKLIVYGLILYTIFSVAYVIPSTGWPLAFIRFMQGFASVMVTPIAQSYIGDITPRGKEGQYMNLFYISLFGGTAIGPSIGGYLSDHISITAPFYATAIAGIISLVLVLILVPESPVIVNNKKEKRQVPSNSLKETIKDDPMRGLMIYMISRGFYRWGFNTFFPIFAVSILALSKTGTGIFLSAYMLAGALLQYPAGVLADRYYKYRNELILIGGILSAIPMFIIPIMSNKVLIFIFMLWMGGLSAFSRASAVAIRTERGRIFGMGSVTGAFTTSMSIGQIIGPIIFGLIYDFSNLAVSFVVGGVIGLIGSTLAYLYLHRNAVIA